MSTLTMHPGEFRYKPKLWKLSFFSTFWNQHVFRFVDKFEDKRVDVQKNRDPGILPNENGGIF